MTIVCVAMLLLASGAPPIAADEVSPRVTWTEIAWPFGRDAWAAGRAFRCMGGPCAASVEFYVRPKIGFCNCATGVADDDELERVGDLYLLGDRYTARDDGHPVAIGDLRGRVRAFTVDLGIDGKRSVVSYALNKRCDVVIATLVARRPIESAAERAASALLDAEPLHDWIEAALQPAQ